jgi:REP element-mobilizing transposase RayT
MPYVKVWIHLIWSTKNRIKLITDDFKLKLYDHIRKNASYKKIYVDYINGSDDHIHLLISMKADESLSKIVQLIKGESSYWVNKNNLIENKFEWQEEYIAISVSESIVPKVREYIKNQEQHHRKKSFNEEFDLFLEKYGFKVLGAKANI